MDRHPIVLNLNALHPDDQQLTRFILIGQDSARLQAADAFIRVSDDVLQAVIVCFNDLIPVICIVFISHQRGIVVHHRKVRRGILIVQLDDTIFRELICRCIFQILDSLIVGLIRVDRAQRFVAFRSQ